MKEFLEGMNLKKEAIRKLLLSFRLVAGREFIKKFGIHFHKSFQHIVDEGNNCLVPVLLADAIQCRKHDWHNDTIVILD